MSIGSGQRGLKFVKCRSARPDHRGSHFRHQRGEVVVVERFSRTVKEVCAALVVDRCGRYAWLDQLDPAAVYDPVVRRGRDGHAPAVMMGDAKTHAADSATGSTFRCPVLSGRS